MEQHPPTLEPTISKATAGRRLDEGRPAGTGPKAGETRLRRGLGRESALLVALLVIPAKLGTAPAAGPLPGMPPLLDPKDVYAASRPGNLSPVVRGFPERVYVPNSGRDTVDVIDPQTFKIVDSFSVGREPQHVVPSYDLKTLWVLSDLGDSITRIDPTSGRKGETIPVADPYNMYYTPDGRYAIVVAERLRRLDFRDPETMKVVDSVK